MARFSVVTLLGFGDSGRVVAEFLCPRHYTPLSAVSLSAFSATSRVVAAALRPCLQRTQVTHRLCELDNHCVECQQTEMERQSVQEDAYWSLIGHLDEEDDCWGV